MVKSNNVYLIQDDVKLSAASKPAADAPMSDTTAAAASPATINNIMAANLQAANLHAANQRTANQSAHSHTPAAAAGQAAGTASKKDNATSAAAAAKPFGAASRCSNSAAAAANLPIAQLRGPGLPAVNSNSNIMANSFDASNYIDNNNMMDADDSDRSESGNDETGIFSMNMKGTLVPHSDILS